MMNKAIYPGFFDPITNGHVDIILRGLKIFDQILVAVLENPQKTAQFSTKDRVHMIREIFAEHDNIQVKAFHGLMVDFARKNGAKTVMRGLRAVSDFEYEFQMALTNRKLDGEIETVFMMPHESFSYVSSKLIKEAASLGADVGMFVPKKVSRLLVRRLGKRR